ncbi:MAG: helix-turn-helix domain-containing protein [Candidatus Thermoplasmatota archaeon]|nr:helix-turn-helix domain-containing protein [Candidatus Thermoplasmatota archaeon]
MDDKCTVYRTVDMVSKKWTMVILLELYRGGGGPKRYNEIKRSLGEITPKVLSTRLKDLEKNELITKRIDASGFPVKTEYELTPMGFEFFKVIQDIKEWALKWKVDNEVCERLDCRECTL